jgi:peptidoglycan/LPS O-acetylase OafA/YrhL
MKLLLAVLGLWSAGCGIYYGFIVDNNQRAFEIGFTLAFLLLFVATLLAVAELPRFIGRRNRK